MVLLASLAQRTEKGGSEHLEVGQDMLLVEERSSVEVDKKAQMYRVGVAVVNSRMVVRHWRGSFAGTTVLLEVH